MHHIDCTGGVRIGAFCTVAGLRSQILTHSIDVRLSKQRCEPVSIGRFTFVGTGSIILMGSALPDYSVLAAGAVLTKKFEQTHGLYAGNPAKLVSRFEADECAYFSRNDGHVA